MSVDVDKIVGNLDVPTLVGYLWSEDPHQLRLKLENLAESIVSRLLGEDEGSHSYSCVMINLPEELAERIKNWGREQIGDEELYVDAEGGLGREEETHVTVKYGLTAVQPDDRLKAVFNKTAPFEVTLGPCSVFENGEFDVVKLDAHSPYLMALNRDVHAAADAPGDKHPVYQPHVTVAYVKSGLGARLVGSSPFDDAMKFGVTSIGKEGKFTADTVIFSSIDGSKNEYPLGHSNLTAKAVEKTVEALGDAEDVSPEAMDTFLKNALSVERKMKMSGARRLFGRALVDRVEVSSAGEVEGIEGFPRHPKGWRYTLLEIYFRTGYRGGLEVWRDYWSSRSILGQALRQWSNLQGAPLIVDGQPAGEISYDNPALRGMTG